MAAAATGGGGIDKSIKYLLIAIAVLIAGAGLYFWWKKQKAKADTESFNKIDNPKDPAAALANVFANQLRGAFNPSGNWWMSSMDGTKYDIIGRVATNMRAQKVTFDKVAAAYFTAYKDDLAKRLQSELSSNELRDFYNRLGKTY